MSFSLHKKLRESLAAIRKPTYTSSHIAVLESLADHANEKTLLCFPSMETIADECYLTDRHVQKVIKQLEQDGVLSITRSARRNDYKMLFPTIVQGGEKRPAFASETPTEASKAPLTYSLNQEVNLGEFKVSSSGRALTGHTPVGVGVNAGKPAKNQETPADVLELHSFLFRNIKRESNGPSRTDVAILQAALDTYGKLDLLACLEAEFHKKKRKTAEGKLVQPRRFYMQMFKGAEFPCSSFGRYLDKMMGEFKDRAERSARPYGYENADSQVAATAHRSDTEAQVPDNNSDFGCFDGDESELD